MSEADQRTDTYRLKKISYKGKTIPLIMQNINGPCPLLAICNILLLQERIRIHLDYGMVNYEQLVSLLGDCLLQQKIPEIKELQDNYNQSVSDAIALFPTLQFGLDVNVRFRDISDFEFTKELTVFDLFNIRLLHGWIVSPENEDYKSSIDNLSYNEVMEKLVYLSVEQSNKETTKNLQREKNISNFMEESASQLTQFGLNKLKSDIGEGEYAVFFRNNHFSVIHKHEGSLYLLVTDQGYLYQQNIVWELFDSVGGDSLFVKADFSIYNPEENTPEGIVNANEIKNDEHIALQLQREEEEALQKIADENRIEQEKKDHEMAMKLQQQENGNSNVPTQTVPQPVASGNSNSQFSNLNEDLYRAFQRGERLTEDQLQQLNEFLGQQQNNENCCIM